MEKKLPRAVREAAQRADEYVAQYRKETLDRMNGIEAPVHAHSEAPTEPETLEVAPVPQEPAIPVPRIVQEPTPEPIVVPQLKTETAEYWEHRFKTSQGIFEADRKKLKEQLVKRDEDLDLMRSQIRDLQKAQREQKASTVNASEFLTPQEMENYSDDTINLVIKVAQKMAAQAGSHIKEDIEDRFVKVENKVKETEEDLLQRQQDLFWDSININVPDWKSINESPQFLAWIVKPDSISGITPDSMIAQAQANLDHKRVIAIFKAFKGSVQSSPVPPRQEARVTPEPVAMSPNSGNTVHSSHPTPTEIRQFYKDKALGRYTHRKAESEAMEKRIRTAFQAQ